MTELHLMLQHLKQPEYIHVLLNPLPVYGLALGMVALVVAWIARSRAAQAIALLIVALAGASAWPVVEFGQGSYDRVYAMSNNDAQQWLDVHATRASRFAPVFYAVAVLAVATIFVPWKFPKANNALLALTLAATLVALGLGGWIGHAGGQVRHSEFRKGPPPEPVSRWAHTD
jgi:hypothetical protein